MPLERIGDLPESCTSPDHFPPKHISLQPGVYQHTCSLCGHSQIIRVYPSGGTAEYSGGRLQAEEDGVKIRKVPR